jgi:hypothetical protein
MKKLSIVFLLVLLSSTMIFAQDTIERLMKGTDKPLFQQGSLDSPSCFVYEQFIVKTNAEPSKAGEMVMAYNRIGANPPEESCRTKGGPILSLEANYSGKSGYDKTDEITSTFYGMVGKHLFIQKSVMPFQGAFEVFDLTTGKSVFKADMYPTMKILAGKFVYFENWSKKDGALKNCKEAKAIKKRGMAIGWIEKKQLDLETLKVQKLGLRCEATKLFRDPIFTSQID